jgi:hypothetical protein
VPLKAGGIVLHDDHLYLLGVERTGSALSTLVRTDLNGEVALETLVGGLLASWRTDCHRQRYPGCGDVLRPAPPRCTFSGGAALGFLRNPKGTLVAYGRVRQRPGARLYSTGADCCHCNRNLPRGDRECDPAVWRIRFPT